MASRQTPGPSWSFAKMLAAVTVGVVALLVVFVVLTLATVPSASTPTPSTDPYGGWTRVPIATWTYTIRVDYAGSTSCNPVTTRLDDAAYQDVDSQTRYVSLHVLTTRPGADPRLSECGFPLLTLVDETGHRYSDTVYSVPNGDGEWTTFQVFRVSQHLRVDGLGVNGVELTGTPSLY